MKGYKILLYLIVTLLVIPLVTAKYDNFTYKAFECDMSTTGKTIGYVTITFVIIILWMYALITKNPILNLIFGLVTIFYAWNVAKCFFLANVLFIVMGIFSLGYALIFAFKQKDKV